MGSQLHLLYVVLMAERLSGSPIWMVLTSGWSHAWPARRDFHGAQCWSGSLGKQGAAGCAWALRGLWAGAASPCPSALAAGTGGAMQRRLPPVPCVSHGTRGSLVTSCQARLITFNEGSWRKEIILDQRLHFYFRNPGRYHVAYYSQQSPRTS